MHIHNAFRFKWLLLSVTIDLCGMENYVTTLVNTALCAAYNGFKIRCESVGIIP